MTTSLSALDPLECKLGRFCTLNYKAQSQKTHVPFIELVIDKRMTNGSEHSMPYFYVTLKSGERKHVSITKHGWRKAWRKALQCKVSIDGNALHAVRFMNKPPHIQSFIA